jgi:predicted transcriptional regulator
MKTAISIPNDVFATAENLAKRLNKSRSQIYSEAVAEYVARHDASVITDRINAVCADVDTRPDSFTKAAARRTLSRTEW